MNNKKKIIISVVTLILAVTAVFFGITYTDEDINKIVDGIETVTNIIENTTSTTEIPKLKQEDEQTLEVQETDLENEGFERQGNIAYDGSDKAPIVPVGEYKGLTYYSQADSRWANHMYSAIGDKEQTMMQSGCGPTAAAMVVSSIRGTITPDIMGDLFVKYGYRSTNNGTYFSAMKWTADAFNIGYKETYSLDTAVNLLKDNYYVVVSCNEGLFTYGGHFIVLVGVTENTLKIYDPYLYNGKFNTSSRRGKATVNGNSVYVTVNNFKKYANATKFYCYKNDRTDVTEDETDIVENETETSVKQVNYKVKVIANSGLNIRTGANTSYKIVGGYTKNTTVTITAESNGWGKTNKGWICLDYTTKISSPSTVKKHTTGRYKVNTSVLTVRSGPGTNYSWKKFSQLTKNAQEQVAKLNKNRPNGLIKNVACDVSQTTGNWGKIPSGWICLDYCIKTN